MRGPLHRLTGRYRSHRIHHPDRHECPLNIGAAFARLVAPIPQQTAVHAMPARNVGSLGPRLEALGQDPGLLLRRPRPPARFPSDQLNPPVSAALMTLLMTVMMSVIKLRFRHRLPPRLLTAQKFVRPPPAF